MSVSFVRRLLVAAYLVEAGLLLVIVPWTQFWDHNYFGLVVPALRGIMVNEFVRGAISGIGLITLVAGVRDLSSAILAKHADRTEAGPSAGGVR
jgi:hypothetical protein